MNPSVNETIRKVRGKFHRKGNPDAKDWIKGNDRYTKMTLKEFKKRFGKQNPETKKEKEEFEKIYQKFRYGE